MNSPTGQSGFRIELLFEVLSAEAVRTTDPAMNNQASYS